MSADSHSICPECSLYNEELDRPTMRENYELSVSGEILEIEYWADCEACKFDFYLKYKINLRTGLEHLIETELCSTAEHSDS